PQAETSNTAGSSAIREVARMASILSVIVIVGGQHQEPPARYRLDIASIGARRRKDYQSCTHKKARDQPGLFCLFRTIVLINSRIWPSPRDGDGAGPARCSRS